MQRYDFTYSSNKDNQTITLSIFAAEDVFVGSEDSFRKADIENLLRDQVLGKIAQYIRYHHACLRTLYLKSIYIERDFQAAYIHYKVNDTAEIRIEKVPLNTMQNLLPDTIQPLPANNAFDWFTIKESDRWLFGLTLEGLPMPPISRTSMRPAQLTLTSDSKRNSETPLQNLDNYIRENILFALYNAARETYIEISHQCKQEHHKLLEQIEAFNSIFDGIATIHSNLGLSLYEECADKLTDLPLTNANESLQSFVDRILRRSKSAIHTMPAFEHIKTQLNQFNQAKFYNPITRTEETGNFFETINTPISTRAIGQMKNVPVLGAKIRTSQSSSPVALFKFHEKVNAISLALPVERNSYLIEVRPASSNTRIIQALATVPTGVNSTISTTPHPQPPAYNPELQLQQTSSTTLTVKTTEKTRSNAKKALIGTTIACTIALTGALTVGTIIMTGGLGIPVMATLAIAITASLGGPAAAMAIVATSIAALSGLTMGQLFTMKKLQKQQATPTSPEHTEPAQPIMMTISNDASPPKQAATYSFGWKKRMPDQLEQPRATVLFDL